MSESSRTPNQGIRVVDGMLPSSGFDAWSVAERKSNGGDHMDDNTLCRLSREKLIAEWSRDGFVIRLLTDSSWLRRCSLRILADLLHSRVVARTSDLVTKEPVPPEPGPARVRLDAN